MATTVSTVPAFMAALRDGLAARFAADGNLAEVRVFAAPAGDPYPQEMIEFFGTDDSQAWGALGNRRRTETYTVRGMTGVVVPGGGEDTADQARARVYAILAVLEDYLRTHVSVGDTVLRAQLTSANLTQGYAKEGRWAALEITIEAYTELTSS